MVIDTIEQFAEWHGAVTPYFVQGIEHRIEIPCVSTVVVKRELVLANTYNPNSVPDSKMELLMQSIIDNGFAYPIAVIFDPDLECFVIVDGYHRHLITASNYLGLPYIPVVVLSHNAAQRMIATIQFNKARGFHQVDMDADVIRALIEQGMSEQDVSTHLGIDLDTVHRYKQLTGIAELFKGAQYSAAWEMKEQ